MTDHSATIWATNLLKLHMLVSLKKCPNNLSEAPGFATVYIWRKGGGVENVGCTVVLKLLQPNQCRYITSFLVQYT